MSQPVSDIPVDEAELVAAARDGDRDAFDALVRSTFTDTFTLARRLTGNDEDAHDVVQDAYLRAWRGIGNFRGDAAFSTWMYRITANASANVTSRRRRQRVASLDDVREPVDERHDAQPALVLESVEAASVLGAAVDALPTKLRAVVVLKDVYELSHEEIANELGISVSAAKVRLHRGRKQLRDTLEADEVRAHAI